ncbi:hypothetical protein GOBAR_AA04632 [Gossypium barbadense]|uniref:endo-polygalacturonase n=2 Tax=Gossypium TaxID=3633 RepID=A0A2P5YK51_GOSBA|nr:hypothetical protein GOBAR_AA04632 [Gossypium barbadense]
MGSQEPKAVTINVTGFKKFQGIAHNPTETIVNNLKNFVESKGLLPAGVTLRSCTVLETAGNGALPVLLKVLESGISGIDTKNELVIWLHLGVDGGAQKFTLEQQAVNEASFFCPDELGWQPMRQPIVTDDGGISRKRQTTCSIEAILRWQHDQNVARSMRLSGFLSLIRTLPILAQSNYRAFTSYRNINADLGVYYKNKTINELIRSRRLDDAQNLFDQMSIRDSITYNLLITGHGRYGNPKQALYIYKEMVSQEIQETGPTFSSVITVCANEGFYREGIQVHCRVISLGFGLNLFIGSSLVNLYFHMGLVDVAWKLFDQLPERNLAVWNLLLNGFLELGKIEELFGLHDQMKWEGVNPNGLSFCYLIRACCNARFLDEGMQLHCHAIKAGWVECNVFVANALVDFYSACGNFIDARKAFLLIPVEDVISWNSIISVYAENDLLYDAIELLSRMHFWDKKPSIRSIVGLLNLSSRREDILLGRQIHCFITKVGFDLGSVHIQSALIDMYGKCGEIESSLSVYERASKRTLECCNSLITSFLHCGITGCGHFELSRKVFETLPLPNIFCFASIINGYARNAMGNESVSLLEAMIHKGLVPDKVTFLCVLNGCNHAGLLEEGKFVFNLMKSYGICPERQHFSCMVDLLGRAGLVYEAEELLQQSPGGGDSVMWSSLLRSCRVHKNEIVVGGNMLYDKFNILGELEDLDIAEEDMELFEGPSWISERGGKVLVNVDSFGAVGDGVSDDTEAFRKAWNTSCSTSKSVLLVPPGRRYLVNATRFKGPCEERLVVQIDGTIVAPDEPNDWDANLPRNWLVFSKLEGVVFQGNGVIDGSGSKWWASSCKKNKSNPCRGAPTALTIDSSSSIKVKGLTIQNSQQMNFVISRCESVRVSEVQVSCPGDSPNTDGIHITGSTNVVLQDSKIGTGDDCISIVNASSGIKMKRIYCGPGHGVSIGSLGKDNSTAVVTKVVLDTALLRETTNGVRIKTWQGGSGYVRGVRFENVRMEDVANPIIIDQFYCDSPKTCQNQTSAVQISQIMYRNISGTTKSKEAMKFACSDTTPCSNIVLSNINLEKKDGTAETYCNSAQGFGYGIVHPSADCLSSNDKGYILIDHKENSELAEPSRDHIVHTEL